MFHDTGERLDMEGDILVSVIIPVYNVCPFLAEAIESVINQTYKNLEILVIDDGSTDGSEIICDEYAKDPRVRVIHQNNKGLSAARNVGLDIMTGDLVAFLDSDDKFLPDFIRLMVSAMSQCDADIVLCKSITQQTKGEMVFTGKEELRPSILPGLYDRVDALRARVDGSINPNVWNKLYKRSLWRNIRFPVDHVYEDIATSYKILDLCQTIFVINDVLHIRRIRNGSITNVPSARNRFDYVLSLSQIESFIEANIPEIFSPEHLQRVRTSKLYQMINCYLLSLSKQAIDENMDANELRNHIILFGKEVWINCEVHIRIIYLLLCYCPWFLQIVYPMHRSIRALIRKESQGLHLRRKY